MRQLLLKLWSRDPSDAWRLADGQWDENIFRQDIDQIPCTDLLTIDQLWVKYSNGLFGFSIQKNIYLDVGGKLDGEKRETEWAKFAIAVGWKQVNYNLDNMIYATSAPKGHLPICLWFGGICFSRIALKLERCKSAA